MIMSSRIIWSDNGVIKDLSVNQNSLVEFWSEAVEPELGGLIGNI